MVITGCRLGTHHSACLPACARLSVRTGLANVESNGCKAALDHASDLQADMGLEARPEAQRIG